MKWSKRLENSNLTERPTVRFRGSRTKTAERRIRSLIRRNKSFILQTTSIEDGKTKEEWVVDSGGWVSIQYPDGRFRGFLGHIKNLLEFLKGSQPMWYDPDRPEKRKYVRRNVRRGGLA